MTLRQRVRRILEDSRTEALVGVLILISVVLVLAEAWLHPADPMYDGVRIANDAITLLFVVELSIRYYAEPTKKRFFRQYWYDILAVLPLFRVFRFLRVLRLLRLYRFGLFATRRLQQRFRLVRLEYVIVGLTVLTVVLMGALSMRVVEGRANPDFSTLQKTAWFAVMTVLGGEPIGGTPTTTMGRMVTLVLMFSGMTVFAVLTGTVSAVMVDVLKQIRLYDMDAQDLDEHVVVCGWNQAGPLVLADLLFDNDDEQFIIITESAEVADEPVVQNNPGRVMTLTGDCTRVDCLREARISRANTALVLADATNDDRSAQDRDARTVLTAMLVERLGDDIYTTVQLLNRDNETSLRRMGVEEIIVSEEFVGNIMATVARNNGIVAMLDELMTATYGHQFYRCQVPKAMVGMNVGKAILHLKKNHDATLLAVDVDPDADPADIPDDEPGLRSSSVRVNPPVDLVLEEDHYLFVTASEPIVTD